MSKPKLAWDHQSQGGTGSSVPRAVPALLPSHPATAPRPTKGAGQAGRWGGGVGKQKGGRSRGSSKKEKGSWCSAGKFLSDWVLPRGQDSCAVN